MIDHRCCRGDGRRCEYDRLVALPHGFVDDLRATLGEPYVLTEPEQLATYDCDGLTGWRARPAGWSRQPYQREWHVGFSVEILASRAVWPLDTGLSQPRRSVYLVVRGLAHLCDRSA